jgi:hypothetical protein
MSQLYDYAPSAPAYHSGGGRLRFLAISDAKRRRRGRAGLIRAALAVLACAAALAGGFSAFEYHAAHRHVSAAAVAGMSYADRAVYAQKIGERLRRKPDSLRNFSGSEVLAALSQPSLKRSEGMSHVWQYRDKGCILDVFLGGAAAEADAHVVHYEVRPRRIASLKPAHAGKGGARPDAQGCVTALLDQNAHNKALAALMP